uniref:Secreted protein n=1 Tax=Anopheles farauti TaxID=69004 RepID=A0A182QWZ3_9DIPT
MPRLCWLLLLLLLLGRGGTELCLVLAGPGRAGGSAGIRPIAALLLAQFRLQTARDVRAGVLPEMILPTDGAGERTFRVVALLVARQVILALEGRIADVADKPALEVVPDQVLLEQLPLRVRHLTLGTKKQQATVQGALPPVLPPDSWAESRWNLPRIGAWLWLKWAMLTFELMEWYRLVESCEVVGTLVTSPELAN